MYFIEILSKIFGRKTCSKFRFGKKTYENQTPEDEKCEHLFVPIDSTGKVFACVNCGFVINEKPKNLNFFERDKDIKNE